MSDIKLINIKDKENYSKGKINKVNMQKIIEENCFELLGLQLIDSNYNIQSHPGEIIETIGIDENYQLAIIEYRQGKYSQTINKGLFFVDYINNHLSEFKLLVVDKLGQELAKQVTYKPRLICIGDDFNHYDEYAINQLPLDIDLIKFQSFTRGFVVIEKGVCGRRQIRVREESFKNSIKEKELLEEIRKFVLSLGDEVVESDFGLFLSYRRIKNFMYITNEEGITIKLKLHDKYRSYVINTLGDFNRSKTNIESAYDQN